jgi:hypothetical protein
LNELSTDFRSAADAFETAYADRGASNDYLVAGRPVRIRVAGAALAEEVDLPLRHLRIPGDAAPAMTIDLWNQEETGVPAVLGDQERLSGPYGHFSMSDDGRYLGEQRVYGALWYDRDTSRVVGSVEGLGRRALDERARPFHRIFSIWLWDGGIQFVHSGLVARPDPVTGALTGVLFVGAGGSGKTTSSIACFQSGLVYLGDDFIGLEQTGAGFAGHGLYGSCLVNVDHIRRFPALDARSLKPRNDYEDKSLVYLAPIDAGRLASRVPIAAVVMPKVVDRPDTVFRRATKGQALLSLAPSSIMSLPMVTYGAMDRLAGLIDAVPAYWLELGRDVNAIPGAVNSLFDTLGPTSQEADR